MTNEHQHDDSEYEDSFTHDNESLDGKKFYTIPNDAPWPWPDADGNYWRE